MDAVDVIEIHQLLGRYGHAIDGRDWETFASLFVPDAVLDYTAVRAPGVCTGIGEILAYFESANHPAAHHVSNIVVSRDGDVVRVHSKWQAPFTRATHDPVRLAGGDYHDVVVKVDGSWRFQRKECVQRWQLTPDDHPDLAPHRHTF